MEPTEAMIEAGAKALWDQDPHRIRWSELREATKTMARIQARDCLRAALKRSEVLVANDGSSMMSIEYQDSEGDHCLLRMYPDDVVVVIREGT